MWRIVFTAFVLFVAFEESAADVLQLSSEEIGKMSLASRVKYLNAFMRQKRAAHEAIRQEDNLAADPNDQCTPDMKFQRCCNQIQATCALVDADAVMSAACHYPPQDLSLPQQVCLGYYFNEYIMCYADGQDNSGCCDQAGVEKDCTYMLVFHADCRDFCRGIAAKFEAKTGYHCCEPYAPKIAACNKQASDMGTDTAAMKYGFCKRHCSPPWPEYCKQEKSVKLLLTSDDNDANDTDTSAPLPLPSELPPSSSEPPVAADGTMPALL